MKFQEVFVKRYYRISQEGNQLIKTKMAERNLSKAKLASLIGTSESYMDHLTRNDRNFREDQLQKILPFFAIKLSPASFIPQDTIHGKFINLPNESSPELMQIIGYFLGDGNLQKRSLRFKDANKEVLKVYQGLIEKVFNVKGRIASQKETIAYLLEVNSLYLRNWFQENITLKKEEFLEEVGQLPNEEIAAFLRGIFDAEGSVNLTARQVNLRLTDANIVKTSQILLLKFDITASFYKAERGYWGWHDYYDTYFSNRASFKQFIDIIGFSSKEKLKKLGSLILKKNKKN